MEKNTPKNKKRETQPKNIHHLDRKGLKKLSTNSGRKPNNKPLNNECDDIVQTKRNTGQTNSQDYNPFTTE